MAEPLVEPDFVRTSVADCPSPEAKSGAIADIAAAMIDEAMPAGGEYFNRTSADETLFLNFVANGASRQWKLWMRKDGRLADVMNGSIGAVGE